MGIKSKNYFNTQPSARGQKNINETHKCLVLPWDLHRAAVEIAFREDVKFKDMMTIVIGKEVNRLEKLSPPAQASPSFTFSSSEKYIHTSAFLPKDLIICLKKVSHYSGINEKQIIANGLAGYLQQEYSEKYPDLVRPIGNYNLFESK